jgi:hypothetical protein
MNQVQIDKWTKEIEESKCLLQDKNLMDIISFYGLLALQSPALATHSMSIVSLFSLSFMAGRDSMKREMAMRKLLESEGK